MFFVRCKSGVHVIVNGVYGIDTGLSCFSSQAAISNGCPRRRCRCSLVVDLLLYTRSTLQRSQRAFFCPELMYLLASTGTYNTLVYRSTRDTGWDNERNWTTIQNTPLTLMLAGRFKTHYMCMYFHCFKIPIVDLEI